ncbi:hypothetical protein EJ05DRAFT_432991 [Pseudovirgaria hyperparasitica]|uniref:Zn(2)-C6 fungal-type domain-containing protein n=1 Tax=Pseudovirgaria hyperparasitica TaxID=470096 RepID=A0A6A6WKS0_9PEZI|nr:uncharacterized protein EJ05DRAFT_432991 [Pseudovirgaria hyperparasitica]KAF2762761.1 hypothetical protein EJ05DRAFT_432991 [Pseudovirgaria hyperparasitica]
MKCDEVKPVCGPCAKGNRDCVYGHAKSALDARLQTIPALSTLPTQHWAQNKQRHSPGSEPDLGQLPWNQTTTAAATSYGDSQDSTPVSSVLEPHRWFGLLAEDCPFDDNDYFTARRNEMMRLQAQSASNSPTARASLPDTDSGYPTPQMSHLNSPHLGLPPSLMPSMAPRSSVPNGDERELWQAPITLTDHQICLFSTFVNHLSLWLDLYDPLKHFSTMVPQLALSNEGLMKAILALAARHLSIKPQDCNVRPDRTEAVQYYSETLQYLQRAMKYESYTRSPDIIATALIVSAYEMIDGAGKSWERHLKGVFWIQRSQENHGESGGLRQAVWWAWLRQDIWAAFRERRKCFSFWRPKKSYSMMNQYEIANRVVYLAAQAVNYASEEERKAGEANVQQRMDNADTLLNMLDDWKRHLSIHFQELPIPKSSNSDAAFQIHWINPSPFACAMQYYHFARILLMIHRPAPGGYLEYSNRNSTIAESIDVIGGIAMTIKDHAATILSTQALYCAALYTSDPSKQAALCKMIEEHQDRTGWPVIQLNEELRMEWSCQGPL